MINLSIINPLSCVAEPPSSVTIIDYSGTAVEDTAGPYQLDTILTLTCVSSGGEAVTPSFYSIINHFLTCHLVASRTGNLLQL